MNTSSSVEVCSPGMGTSLCPMWLPDVDGPDRYVEFRGHFHLASAGGCRFCITGASWFVATMNGKFLCEGPVRFSKEFPVHEEISTSLASGDHEVRAIVHHHGVATRMLEDIPPFLAVELEVDGRSHSISWEARVLTAYSPCVRRLNPELGWIEWCDTRKLPGEHEDWRGVELRNRVTTHSHGLARILQTFVAAHRLADGPLRENFGYRRDDPPVGFFLRSLCVSEAASEGHWWRFDLGRVRLGRPEVDLDLPEGATVEIAYSETLQDGRVVPWLNQSLGLSCHLDHYIARGGRQAFGPITPRGFRYFEVHVIADPQQCHIHGATLLERSYFPMQADGRFQCDEALLNRIWQVGIDTLRACSEDAIVDCPTRERGQWLGDVVNVGLATAACAYSDLRLFRRGLVQAAECAREDGLVASLYPGQRTYLSSYALNWVEAVWHYHGITGERHILSQLLPAARRSLALFMEAWDGDVSVTIPDCWNFMDWGFQAPPHHGDFALLLHFYSALEALCCWQQTIEACSAETAATKEALAQSITSRLQEKTFFGEIGPHEAALLLRTGLVDPDREAVCIEKIKQAFRCAFPWNRDAKPAGLFRFNPETDTYPRLQKCHIVTPYFAHFSLPELARRGAMDFVLDAWRQCWGWALGVQSGTWLELFDARSSQCHQWSSCPTWQMSTFLLGLRPARHLHPMGFEITWCASSLSGAKGVIPIAGTPHTIAIEWKRLPGWEPQITLCPTTAIRVFTQRAQTGEFLDLKAHGQQVIPLENPAP